jgi:hypothetical protein
MQRKDTTINIQQLVETHVQKWRAVAMAYQHLSRDAAGMTDRSDSHHYNTDLFTFPAIFSSNITSNNIALTIRTHQISAL